MGCLSRPTRLLALLFLSAPAGVLKDWTKHSPSLYSAIFHPVDNHITTVNITVPANVFTDRFKVWVPGLQEWRLSGQARGNLFQSLVFDYDTRYRCHDPEEDGIVGMETCELHASAECWEQHIDVEVVCEKDQEPTCLGAPLPIKPVCNEHEQERHRQLGTGLRDFSYELG